MKPRKRATKPRVARSAPRVVAIGGSAGALQAFEQFLQNLPAQTGMAFVLVPHLDPTHKGVMPELLARCTTMPVVEASDGVRAEADHVYVIPPNSNLSILHGKLQLLEPSAPRGQRMSIDFFLRHLAEDQKDKAVCVLLSGMGADGTHGAQAIKANLGMVMVQDPATAAYDAMPRSAIATGLVDYVAAAGELPGLLMKYVRHAAAVPEAPPPAAGASPALEKIFVLLRAQTGTDFSCYKKTTVLRRIERRINVHRLPGLARYAKLLQEQPQELDLLFRELLIGVTSFFRDREAFELIRQKVLPPLVESRSPRGPLRIWAPACSTGEDAYSLAILVRECLQEKPERGGMAVQIFATDLDADAIEKARQGVYPAGIATDVSPGRLARFFAQEDSGYRVCKEIRDMVVFAQQNVIADPPFTRLDLLCCRNLMIYLNAETQKKLLSVFHYALAPGGMLFLGSAESIGTANDLFAPVSGKWKVFRRREVSPRRMVEMPSALLPGQRKDLPGPDKKTPPAAGDLADIAQRSLLEGFAPPAVVITPQGDIVYVNGRTGRFLEPPSGKVDWNVFAMAREGLRQELAAAIRGALRRKAAVRVDGLPLRANGRPMTVNLVVKPIGGGAGGQGLLLVVFEEVPAGKGKPARKAIPLRLAGAATELEKELRRTREQLQTTVEEMETTQEEVRSANEELQSNNEELQSTNEELTTSKEELQSLNEEMQTVNAELQSKVDELSQGNNDMRNLLNGIEMATIFLDNDLKIKRFTPQATAIVNLIGSDVGRPIGHIVANLEYDRLVPDARGVLASLTPMERQVRTHDGRWFTMRLLPYRTADNVIDGLVVTFADITPLKQLENSLRERQAMIEEARSLAENVIATIREPLVVLDADLHVVTASRAFYEAFGTGPAAVEGRSFYDLAGGSWDIPALRKLLEDVLPRSSRFEDFRVECEIPGAGRRALLLNARQVVREGGRPGMILLTMQDAPDGGNP